MSTEAPAAPAVPAAPLDLSTLAPAATVRIPLYDALTGAELPIGAVCHGYYSLQERDASYALAEAEKAAGDKDTQRLEDERQRAYVRAILAELPGALLEGRPVQLPQDVDAFLALAPFAVEQIFWPYISGLALFGRRRPASSPSPDTSAPSISG